MLVANVTVYGTKAYAALVNPITQGISGAKVKLIFADPAWDGLIKNVFFYNSVEASILNSENEVMIPDDVTAEAFQVVKMGVCGVGSGGENVIPTLQVSLGMVLPGVPTNLGTNSADPVWAQLLGMIGNLRELDTEAKDNLVAAINEVMSKSGTAEGYYTPVVTQPTTDTMKIAFVPSVATMPAVEPVTITLPGSDYGQNPTGGGLSATATALLISILRNAVYSTDQSANITALENALATGGGSGGEEEPDTPVTPEKTLTSISAVYSGGDVEAGTAVADLTGIVVTAHYSDGSTETVTGYTLSGTIAEGENVITVVYSGKATTFTVTGFVEVVALYTLPAPVNGDGTASGTNVVDTGVCVSADDIDFTIAIKCNVGKGMICGDRISGTAAGFALDSTGDTTDYRFITGNTSYAMGAFSRKQKDDALVLVHKKGGGEYIVHQIGTDGNRYQMKVTSEVVTTDSTVKIGYTEWIDGNKASYINGTISEFKIYSHAFSEDEIAAYLGEVG